MLKWIIEKLIRLTYRKVSLDKVNQKLIRPVPKLIIDGVQYYQFVQVADMPQNRFIHFLQFNQELGMGIDRKMLNDYINELVKANDKGEASRIGSLLYTLRDTINSVTPVESLYNLSSLVYFDKDEDIGTYDLDYNAEKVQKFKAIKDKDFFFRTLLENNFKITGNPLYSDIVDYLNVSLLKLRAYGQILSGSED